MNEIIKFNSEFIAEVIPSIHKGAVIYKNATGTGGTSLALTNEENVLVLVPNVEQIAGKMKQYNPDGYYKYRMGSVFGGDTETDILYYINMCDQSNQPLKIMCTYDSFSKMVNYLHRFDLILVDEYQKIITYAKLKNRDKMWKEDVLNKMLRLLETEKHKVSFISSTKVDISYLPQWVQGLRQITYEFTNIKKPEPKLLKSINSVESTIKETIIRPLINDGILKIDGFNEVEKVIIFYNNVSASINMAMSCGLGYNEVAFICADTAAKDAKLDEYQYKRLMTGVDLPKITFISSVGFCGLDIYDSSALTVVVSDYTKDVSIIKVEDDLIQCPGRNRDKNNVNYGKYLFIYRTNPFDLTEEEVDSSVEITIEGIRTKINITNLALTNMSNTESVRIAIEGMFTDDEKTYVLFEESTGLLKLNELTHSALKLQYKAKRDYYKNGAYLIEKLETKEYSSISTERGLSYADYRNYFKSNVKEDGTINWASNYTNIENKSILEKSYKYSKGKVYKNKQEAIKVITKNEGNKDVITKLKSLIKPTLLAGHELLMKDVVSKITDILRSSGINKRVTTSLITEFLDENQTIEVYQKSNGKKYIYIK